MFQTISSICTKQFRRISILDQIGQWLEHFFSKQEGLRLEKDIRRYQNEWENRV